MAQSSTSWIISEIKLFDSKNFEEFIGFIKAENRAIKFQKDLIAQISQNIVKQIQSVSLTEELKKKFEILYKNDKGSFSESQIQSIFERIFSFQNITYFQSWCQNIIDIAIDYSNLKTQILQKLKDTIKSYSSDEISRYIFDEILMPITEKGTDDEKKKIGDFVFEIAMDISRMSFGVSKLAQSKILYGDLFSQKVDETFSGIEDMQINNIVQYFPLLTALCDYQSDWNKKSKEEMISILKKLMSDYADKCIELIKKIDVTKISVQDRDDLIKRAEVSVKDQQQKKEIVQLLKNNEK